MNIEKRYGYGLFEGIETIRTSRFSHYLIRNSNILEINGMKAIYLELKAIDELLDENYWGILYPMYKFYKQCIFYYRRIKHLKSTIKLWRMERAIRVKEENWRKNESTFDRRKSFY